MTLDPSNISLLFPDPSSPDDRGWPRELKAEVLSPLRREKWEYELVLTPEAQIEAFVLDEGERTLVVACKHSETVKDTFAVAEISNEAGSEARAIHRYQVARDIFKEFAARYKSRTIAE